MDYKYFKDHYLITACNLSLQKEVDADPRSIQQIESNFMLTNVLQRNIKSLVEYNKVNVRLSNLQLSKIKTAVKNNEGKTLRISSKMFNSDNLPHELFLTQRQITKLRNNIENNMSTDIKFSKPEIKKIRMSGGALGLILGKLLPNLIKVTSPILKNVALPLGLSAAMSGTDDAVQKNKKNTWFWNNFNIL